MAHRVSSRVIRTYSSSFSLATALLDKETRHDIHNLYAVVRVADEIVDGAARGAGLSDQEIARVLDAYEAAVLAAPSEKFHTDPVLHAYAGTARRCNFDPGHLRAFFRSMRMDLDISNHSQDTAADYIYGSAEVIGLLCVAVFTRGRSIGEAQRTTMNEGAQALGAAFQKVNFLRDFGQDTGELNRIYLPEVRANGLDDEAKDLIIADIRADLDTARQSLKLLPLRARVAVTTARNIFSELTNKLDELPAAHITETRVRIPAPQKLILAGRSIALWSVPPTGNSSNPAGRK